MRRLAVITGTVLLGALGAVQLPVLALNQTPAQPPMRTDKGLYVRTVAEPGYDVTVTEIERGTNYSVLDMKGFVPTVTAGGVVLFRAVYDIARERGFSHAFVVPQGQPPRPPAGRTDKGRDVSGVTKVFMITDQRIDLKDLLGGDYSVPAQQLFDRQGYTSIAQFAVLFGGGAAPHEPRPPTPAVSERFANQLGSRKQLLGQWSVVSGEFAGQALPQSRLPKLDLIFEEDGRWRDTSGSEATWVSDESKSPKILELTHTAGRDRGKKQLCAFEVVDNRLTIVFGVPGGNDAQRPIELKTSTDDTNLVLFVFERVAKDSAALLGSPNELLQPAARR